MQAVDRARKRRHVQPNQASYSDTSLLTPPPDSRTLKHLRRTPSAQLAFPILSLPSDIFFEISAFLSRTDLKVLMLSSSKFHPLVIHCLYSHASVAGFMARTFCIALAATGTRPVLYAETVRHLSYKLGNDNPLIAFPLLCAALARAVHLKTLEISIPSDVSPLLKEHIFRADFLTRLHTKVNSAPAQGIFPELDSFCPGESIHLLETVQRRNLRAVCLTKPMGYTEVNYLLDLLNRHDEPTCLLDLRIHLEQSVDINQVLLLIGDVFPTILTLSVEQHGMNPMVSFNNIFFNLCID